MAEDRDELENLSVTGLVSLVRQLLGRVETLERENAALRAENASLREQLRAAKRSGAPFSKGPGPSTPKKPRRRRREGRFERRAEPVPGPGDRVEELRAPLDSPDCPQCGARLEMSEQVATVEDTPAEPVRIIRRFHVEHGVCAVCGWSGMGRHPDPAPGQHGATAHRTRPQVMARALTLHCYFGLPLCRVPAVIRAATGITLGQSAQDAAAARSCARPMRGSGRPCGPSPVVNRMAHRRGCSLSDGVFHSPPGGVPDPLETPASGGRGNAERLLHRASGNRPRNGRSLGHRRTAEMPPATSSKTSAPWRRQGPVGRRPSQGSSKRTLREAIRLWRDHRAGECAPEPCRERGRLIRQKLDRQLRDRRLRDPDNQRLLDGIGLQHDKGRVLLFLERPEMEPTNNRAERRLRGAVIARKVSHCSKDERGARTYEVMKSITATLALRGHQVSSALADMIGGRPLP